MYIQSRTLYVYENDSIFYLSKVDPATLISVADKVSASMNMLYPTLYSFAPQPDGATVAADLFEVFSYLREGSGVNGKSCLPPATRRSNY